MRDFLFQRSVTTVFAREAQSRRALHPLLETVVRNASMEREREFAAGRGCAGEALATFGIHNFPLLCSPDPSPIWPAALLGSISHCPGMCRAAVAPRGQVISLGLDVEQNPPLETGLEKVVLILPANNGQLRQLNNHDPRISWAVLIFSARDAISKSWCSLSPTWRDFHDIALTVSPAAAGVFFFAATTPGATMAGRFHCHREHVYTDLGS